jgi:vacuolar protein sorting-associated protein 35
VRLLPRPSFSKILTAQCADLMMTVGTVYMSIPDAPIKEIMKDMMEMTRGVQHPTRGLFLRHYLSGMTRDHLPVGDDPG